MLFHSKNLSLLAFCLVLTLLSSAGESTATPVIVKVPSSSPAVSVKLGGLPKSEYLVKQVGAYTIP